MRPYGSRHKKNGPCQCEMCGKDIKASVKSRERQDAKKQIREERPGKVK